ncbi:hypothetical protein ONZ45_g13882 [Pleurotus djamor]|nr:hypothetical protein ONZ45_g13882 [Pleurotus djamor]
MSQFLALILKRIRQPRVIAEVIGGILLGPTVMGRIPHFHDRIFPAASMPLLSLTANIGLVLYLFLVGLEVDTTVMKRNFKASIAISATGLIFPLGLGAALGIGIYHEFIDESVNMGYFSLFIAVAMGITAFPVLCRILTELNLLDTNVGITVLSAALCDDVVGWVLLALTVALVNASDGLSALWALLSAAAFAAVLLFPGRWGYRWLARRSGSLETGSPTPFLMTVTIFLVFGSAFYTDIIGVHSIFGGFLAGLIIPHDNGYAISMVEKLEDLVTILFLPIFFTLSGLRTNLGLLNTGTIWGYLILVCIVAFSSKFLGCGGAGRFFGFTWRESGAIGSFMACKGLVELIVLNIGRQAGILDPMTFTMFVVHALVLTFMTTPLVQLFYPERLRTHIHATTPGKHRPHTHNRDVEALPRVAPSDYLLKTRFTVVLERFEQLPMVMSLSQMLQGAKEVQSRSSISLHDKAVEAGLEDEASQSGSFPPVAMNALRLIELTNRTSAVLKVQESDSLLASDAIISVFKTFGQLNRFDVSATLSIVNYEQFPSAISAHVIDHESEMVVIPWCATSNLPETGAGGSGAGPSEAPLQTTPSFHQTSSVIYSEFVRKIFLSSPSDVAVFIDRGVRRASILEQHIVLPFFGGPDDRLGLSLLVQLCGNPNVRATVVRIHKEDLHDAPTRSEFAVDLKPAFVHNTVAADTVYAANNTQTRLQSDTADNVLWDRFTGSSNSHPAHIAASLSRITFTEQHTVTPLRTSIDYIVTSTQQSPSTLVLLGRSRRMSVETHQLELAQLIMEKGHPIGSALPRAIGDVGAAFVASGVLADLLVVQASL